MDGSDSDRAVLIKRLSTAADREVVMELARAIVGTAVLLGMLVVCGMKGKWVFVLLGFGFPVLWVIGAIKLAKPTSWWASRYYGDVSMSESEQHFVLSKRKHDKGSPHPDRISEPDGI
jgi:hypothetical protein